VTIADPRAPKASGRQTQPGGQGHLARNDLAPFLAIAALAFAVRLAYLFEIDAIPLFYNLPGDARVYDAWAQEIAAGDWLGKGVFYQAPLYPYFLAALKLAFGDNLWLIRLFQVFLAAVSCGLVFMAGSAFFSRSSGIAAGLILSFYAPAVFFTALIEKSVLDLFLLAVFLFLLGRALETPKPAQWIGAGAVLGLLGLSRENALVLALVAPVWMALYFSQHRLAARLGWIALFCAGIFLILAPVGLRNLKAGGEFKLTTSQLGANFFIGNNPSADGTYGSVRNQIGEPQLEGKDALRIAQRALGRSLSPGEVSDYWLGRSWEYIRSEPGDWLRLMLRKWLMVWHAREIEDSDDYYIYKQWSWLLALLGSVSHFGTLAPLAALGVLLTLRERRRLWLLYAMIAALALSVAIFYVFGRYRFPLVPMLALFAGAALVESMALYRQKNKRALFIAAGVFLAAAVIVNWPPGAAGPSPEGYNNLANAVAKQGKIDEAMELTLKAVKTDPTYGVAHYNLGNLYALKGQLTLARSHLEEAVRLYPNFTDARGNLGVLLAESGDLDGAIEQFHKALEADPGSSAVRINLGLALAKQGRLSEAAASFEEALKLAPGSAEAWYYLGTLAAAQSQPAKAIDHFRAALRIQPEFAEAHQALAQALVAQGKKEEAVEHYQAALRIMRSRTAPPGKR
jgi:tetratricopeptide (TPR) repeat protein